MSTRSPAAHESRHPSLGGHVPELGPYRLLRLLGKGGLGEVFQALDAQGRHVALKTLRLGDDDQGLAAQAFMREAELGQRLDHPNIVKVLGGGWHEGYAYLVMEYVAGHDLRVHTQAAKLLPTADVLRVVEQVAQAVAAAHEHGVIHRDLKPGNVLVDPEHDLVKVTDFGLARLGDVFRSRTGIIAGTPRYMSPEQLAETSIGAASDLYAVGVMLFELLTARLPHEAPSLGRLLMQVATQAAPSVLSLRPDLPNALAELVAQLLQKEPAARPASAAEVAARLAAIRCGLPASTGRGPAV